MITERFPTNDEDSHRRVRRLDFIVSEEAYRELQELSKKTNRSMTELFRYGIGLMKLAEETKAKKQKLMVVDKSDKAVKEIVIPG